MASGILLLLTALIFVYILPLTFDAYWTDEVAPLSDNVSSENSVNSRVENNIHSVHSQVNTGNIVYTHRIAQNDNVVDPKYLRTPLDQYFSSYESVFIRNDTATNDNIYFYRLQDDVALRYFRAMGTGIVYDLSTEEKVRYNLPGKRLAFINIFDSNDKTLAFIEDFNKNYRLVLFDSYELYLQSKELLNEIFI